MSDTISVKIERTDAPPLFPARPRFEAKLPAELADDVQIYVFTDDFIFNSPKHGRLVIPKGTETNFASIPSVALGYLDDDSPRILCPSVVHDYRYQTGFDREQADEELRLNCIACGMRASQARTVWLAVRMFGGRNWTPPKEK